MRGRSGGVHLDWSSKQSRSTHYTPLIHLLNTPQQPQTTTITLAMSTAESSASARGATAAQFGFDQRQDKTKSNMRPLIEGLRYDHVQRQGKFTDTAKRNLIQNLYRCIEPWEEVWTRGPDPYSGQPVTGRQTNLAHQDLSLDRYGINGPLILHQLQEDGDYERGKHRIPKVRKVRAGRRCGRVLNRMARYYSCK